ncbi:hypothetical protein [Mycobacteroides abscessus]|uniref:hypothetical protein n=1 Tax=Mycobacteroides abscessus TaxID=36809 RepID=UPI0009CD770D|nr:hypothetical protein [Mycobacteroides abscessus]SKD81873.1 Uncharacterised protein [Mycobacteroides abscessus subsp. massiliense]SKH39897.1 Uncharacterised protein [Mycobacteroides abscessus subsp. massiliense]SKI31531.1 Uncharacterised protein [Mycobacteroides abscessus subsp. massiliense]SKJ18114.1 Uncharacterised protein [Mycobacteroides abscessus subsp. massiliense]SKJ91366.1 Uncharacterised protein [Mycobacteroides abscessus subsp. massiliense]
MSAPQQQPIIETVVIKPADAPEYLAKLGITAAHLETALDSGEVAAGNIDEFHPPTAAGTVRWHETVGQLRRGLTEHARWQARNLKNSPRTVRPDNIISIMAIGGTVDTGIEAGHPLAARKKGAATRESIAAGQTTIDIALGTSADPETIGTKTGTWVLLYYRDRDPNQLRCELSLPAGIHEGQFTGWYFRILLDAKDYDPRATHMPNDAGGDDVSFEITEAF